MTSRSPALDQLRKRVADFVRDEVIPVETHAEGLNFDDYAPLKKLREQARAVLRASQKYGTTKSATGGLA